MSGAQRKCFKLLGKRYGLTADAVGVVRARGGTRLTGCSIRLAAKRGVLRVVFTFCKELTLSVLLFTSLLLFSTKNVPCEKLFETPSSKNANIIVSLSIELVKAPKIYRLAYEL